MILFCRMRKFCCLWLIGKLTLLEPLAVCSFAEIILIAPQGEASDEFFHVYLRIVIVAPYGDREKSIAKKCACIRRRICTEMNFLCLEESWSGESHRPPTNPRRETTGPFSSRVC